MNHSIASRLAAAAIGGVLLVGLAGCAASSGASSTKPTSTTWSYGGADGPAHWGAVAKACMDTAESQESPIDIVTASLGINAAATPVETHYASTTFHLENHGHTIEAVPDVAGANTIELDGTTYTLQQFHFHADSEHTVDGVHSDAELHLVHKATDGGVAVLAVFLQPGAASEALAQLFASVPAQGHEIALSTPIDLTNIIPAGSVSAQYDGSLTTPPCTEGVRWNVFLNPVTISAEQLADFTAVYEDNHRPVQPLHGREVDAVPAK